MDILEGGDLLLLVGKTVASNSQGQVRIELVNKYCSSKQNSKKAPKEVYINSTLSSYL